jgi:phage recombination protein Bet
MSKDSQTRTLQIKELKVLKNDPNYTLSEVIADPQNGKPVATFTTFIATLQPGCVYRCSIVPNPKKDGEWQIKTAELDMGEDSAPPPSTPPGEKTATTAIAGNNLIKEKMQWVATRSEGYGYPIDKLTSLVELKCIPADALLVAPHRVVTFLIECKERGINPLLKEAWLLPFKDPSTNEPSYATIIAREFARKAAHKTRELAGIDPALYDGMPLHEWQAAHMTEGKLDPNARPLSVSVTVYRMVTSNPSTGQMEKVPFTVPVNFSTYDTGKSRWAKDPFGMIAKVAEMHSTRAAFTEALAGLYVEEEFDRAESGHVDDEIQSLMAEAHDINDFSKLEAFKRKHVSKIMDSPRLMELVKERTEALGNIQAQDAVGTESQERQGEE